MKKLLFSLSLIGICLGSLQAQQPGVAIGTNGAAPDPSAILELESTERGFLLPRMNTTERNAISPLPEGLMIFNTDSNCLEYYNGTDWISPCASALYYFKEMKINAPFHHPFGPIKKDEEWYGLRSWV